MDRLLLYVMSICEPYKNLPFSLIYAYSAVEEDTVPSSDHLNILFGLFANRYHLHLSAFFVVHPTASFRLYLAMTYLSNGLFKNCICLDTIKGLNPYMDLPSIDLPLIVKNYETMIHN